MSIKIDLKIFLFAILFLITKQIKLYAILMIFALIHELGHLICGLLLGLKPKSIKINPFGVQLTFKDYIEDYNYKVGSGNILCLKKMIIAIAGPLTNLTIALALLIIPINLREKDILIYANILLAIFNLIPIYPLDGGRILKEVINIKSGREKSYKVINAVSNITVILLTFTTAIAILYIHNIALLIILGYLWYLNIQNQKNYKFKLRIYECVNDNISL